MANTNPARGMRDFLPADVRKREYVIGIIKEVYESYGFEPLETPAVENIETLTGKYGEEGNQLIYKILKRGEKLDVSAGERELSDLALRYDLTVPLARVVANRRNDLPKFFKRYQIQPVWRADRPARGRFREFYQCDVDAIGSSSMMVEAELCAAVSEILERLGFNDFVIHVNHRIILAGILEAAGVEIDKHTAALIAIDKLDKIGREGVTKEFLQRGVSLNSAEKLLIFFESIVDSNVQNTLGKLTTKKVIALQKQLNKAGEDVSKLKSLTIESYDISQELITNKDEIIKELLQSNPNADVNSVGESLDRIFRRTREIKDLTQKLEHTVPLKIIEKFLSTNNVHNNIGISSINELLKFLKGNSMLNRIMIDPTLARGLSYYTGAIFEISVPDLAGSLGGGGRYDGLIGMFGKEQIPACGFSLGLERILVVMEERGMFPLELSGGSADVLVTVWNEESIGESLKLAAELRREKLRVLVYPEPDKLGKQFKYADSIRVPFVCVLGETELAEDKVTLKNLPTGTQELVGRKDVAQKIKE